MPELPSGTVTLLFTDIEDSTRLLWQLGEQYAGVPVEHQRVVRAAFAAHGGREVDAGVVPGGKEWPTGPLSAL